MRRLVFLILACIIIIPFAARSQNGGDKTTSFPQPVQKPPMHPKITQEMSVIQEQGISGGGTNASETSYKTSGIYLEPGWAPGKVMLSDNSILENLYLRYDLYHQQIQFIRENDTLAFARPEEVKCFMMDERKFIYTDFQSNGINGKSYFEILADGNCRLLLRRVVTYHLDPETQTDQADNLYVRENEYFIEKDGNIARPVRACRKSVLCAFEDKEAQVKGFMDDHKMKMNTCEQLKEVVVFYNTLQ